MDGQLRPHEWLAVVALICVVVLLTLIAFKDSHSKSHSHSVPGRGTPSAFITVEIEGSVTHPGTYQLPGGTQLGELLEIAQPFPEANLKGIRKAGKLKNGQVVTIQEKPLFTIHVKGAVRHPGPLQIHQGCRMVDLLGLVAFDENADRKWVNKKRKLKDQEEIVIPYVKSPKNDTNDKRDKREVKDEI